VDAVIDGWLRLVDAAARLVPGTPLLWVFLFLAARLLYVGYIGVALRAQDRRGALTARWGDRAHERFARIASWMMNVDGVVLAVATGKHAGEIEQWRPGLFVLGWALVALGVAVTILTARALGLSKWLWEDFFVPSTEPAPPPRGLYRIVDDPKYVLGYSHAYGWALLCFSATGLALSLVAHVAILTYNRIVERPHFLALKTRARNGEVTATPEIAGEET
jgi:hypothetical protein